MPLAQTPDLIPVLPEIFLAAAALGLLLLGVFQRAADRADQARAAHMASGLSVIVLVLTLLLVLTVSGERLETFGGMFISDGFATFFKVLVLIASALCILIAGDFLDLQQLHRFEYPVLVLLATLGMLMMISAGDLVALYLGLELQSLALYVLAAFQRDDTRATEAGLKYFVLGAVASGMLLYGCSLIYGFTGTTDFARLAHAFEGGHASMGVVVGLVFVMAGLAFKVSAVPFHMWTPDVYEGAPTPVTAFFAAAPKLAAVALFVRVMVGPFGDLAQHWQQIVVLISMASMVLGAFAAIQQTNIKRLMAYSSIGHVGYALIGLAVGTRTGIGGVMIYMAIYVIMNIGTFACILGMKRGGRMVERIDDLAGLSKTHPWMAAALTLFMFSMAGIPPLAGFFGKLFIFLAAIDGELYTLAIVGVLSSVVSAFYYLRIVKIMYFDEAAEPLDRVIGRTLGLVLLGTGLVILLFFVYPAPLTTGADLAAATLFPG